MTSGWIVTARQPSVRLARSCEARQGLISEGIDREPSLRILRLINEVLPFFSGSVSLPVHAGERQISIVSSSFPIAINCQIKELVLDDFNLRVSHSRSGKPIKKVNQRVNRFHASVRFRIRTTKCACVWGIWI